ncbi:hypothetical protein LIER_16919 [Lithospermum erythrorhizon]|uniref:Endonuclease/exonuclease/phosphatase domain-containing protein n=1 Tax=Lithospermum erythrorhizon TaxID=34254 RepID=A0AAV3QCJ3_LITER
MEARLPRVDLDRISNNPSVKGSFYITVICAKCDHKLRKDLWDGLAVVCTNQPWMAIGDFNALTGTHEMFSRLDRVVGNTAWLELFSNSKVSHLARTHSDHPPILLDLSSECLRNKSSFKFQNMWTSHENFIKVVRDVWELPSVKQGIGKFIDKIQQLKKELKQWNISHFDNIFVELQKAEAEVKNKERDFELTGSEHAKIALSEATSNHKVLMNREEMYWKQKSFLRWELEGDWNTKWNKIHGTWIEGS